MTNYRKLEVWTYSIEMVREIYKVAMCYPKEEMFGLTSQTKRAAVSIPSNIAEGLGRNHKKDCIQFLYIARGSAYELETLLYIAEMNGFISTETGVDINKRIDSSIRLINGFINHLQKQQDPK